MSDTAAQELQSYIDRIERIEEARKDLADDIAEVYKELTGRGFDKVAAKVIVKIRRTDDGLAKWTGASETVDFYLSALGMLPPVIEARAPAHVRVENTTKFPPHDPETGEITDTQEQPETASQSSGKASVSVDPSIDRVSPPASQAYHGGDDANAGGKHDQSVTEESLEISGNASLAAREDEQAAAPIPHSSEPTSSPVQADQTSEAVNPPAASLVTPDGTKLLDVNSGSDPLLLHPSLAAGQAGAVTSLEDALAPATNSDDDVPAFLRKGVPVDVTSPEFIKRLRPFCQNLDDCHGHGRECAKCKAARAA